MVESVVRSVHWQAVLTREFLDSLTMQNSLGLNLVGYPSWLLREHDIDVILEDCEKIAGKVHDRCEGLDVRVKSADSLRYKVSRRYGEMCVSSSLCVNDVIGFRFLVKDFRDIGDIPDWFTVVDMSNGKVCDDGYRAVHLYYAPDEYSYAVEIQFWAERDFNFHNWLHEHVYKNEELEDRAFIGEILRSEFDCGIICEEADLIRKVNEICANCA